MSAKIQASDKAVILCLLNTCYLHLLLLQCSLIHFNTHLIKMSSAAMREWTYAVQCPFSESAGLACVFLQYIRHRIVLCVL